MRLLRTLDWDRPSKDICAAVATGSAYGFLRGFRFTITSCRVGVATAPLRPGQLRIGPNGVGVGTADGAVFVSAYEISIAGDRCDDLATFLNSPGSRAI